jgi:photosystem II stability/assembly factor-like uncharacterized protein
VDGTVYLASGASPCDAAEIYRGGVLATTDGGLTWQEHNSGLEELHRDMRALALDQASLYAAGLDFFRSTDSAATWQHPAGFGDTVWALALGAGHPATLYAGSYTAVSASDDGGETWSTLDGQAFTGLRDVAYDPETATLYAATADGLFSWAP